MIQYGTIKDFKYEPLGSGKKLLLKVLVDNRLTNWLPVKTKASSFLVEHIPVRINDQVIVFNPFGDNEDGFVDRNLTYKDIPLPNDVNENKFYQKFEDGTVYIHDVKEKNISLTTPCSLDLDVDVLTIKANHTKFIGGKITHDGKIIDKTHTHTQTAGNHFGAGATTTPVN